MIQGITVKNKTDFLIPINVHQIWKIEKINKNLISRKINQSVLFILISHECLFISSNLDVSKKIFFISLYELNLPADYLFI